MVDDKILRIRLIGDAKGAVKAFGEVEAASTTLGSRIRRVSEGFTSVGKRMKSIGHGLNHYVSLPIIAAGAASVKFATDFNTSMLRIHTQAGGTMQDVRRLSREVLALHDVQFTPVELANALYHLKSVGMDNVAAMKALHAGAKLAAIGNADLEETVNAVAGAWRTGVKGTQNFGKAIGNLNAIVGAGNMSMGDLNDAMGTGMLASARVFGISLKQAGAALALMTDEGVPANAAATRLRMSFSLMGAPTKNAAKMLQSIGINAMQLGRTMQHGGLIATLDLLQKHLKNLSKAKQADIISRAFGGGRSSSAIMTMLNNLDVLHQKYDQITHSAQRFGNAVKQQAKSPKAQFKELIATLERIAVEIGTKLLPYVVKGAHMLERFLNWFEKLPKPAKSLAMALAGIAAVLGPMLVMLGTLSTVIGALLTPVGAVVAGIAALGIALVVAYKKSATFRKQVKKAWHEVVSAAKPVIGMIKNQLVPAFKRLLPVIKPVVKFIGGLFVNVIASAIKGVIQVVKGLVQIFTGVFNLIADLIHGKWRAAAHDLWSIVKGAFNVLVGMLRGSIVGSVVGALVSMGHNMIMGLVHGIEGMASAALHAVENVVGGAISWAKQKLGIKSPSKVFHQIGRWTGKGFVKGLISTRDEIKQVVSNLVSHLTTIFEEGGLKSGKAATLARAYKQALNDRLHALRHYAGERERIVNRINKAHENLNARIKASNEFTKSMVTSARDFGGIMSVFNPEDENSALSMAFSEMKGRVADMQNFLFNIRKLVHLGLNKDDLKKFMNAGPEQAGMIVSQLAGGGKANVKEMNKLHAEFTKLGKQMGATAHREFFKHGIEAQRRFIHHLTKHEHHLTKAMRRLAHHLQKLLRHSLVGIVSGHPDSGLRFIHHHGKHHHVKGHHHKHHEMHVHIHIAGNVIGDKDFAKKLTPAIRDELIKISKRNGGKHVT